MRVFVPVHSLFFHFKSIKPGKKGAFQSNLVLKLFARSHLKKTIEATSHYGYPIGGLALTTASVRFI